MVTKYDASGTFTSATQSFINRQLVFGYRSPSISVERTTVHFVSRWRKMKREISTTYWAV